MLKLTMKRNIFFLFISLVFIIPVMLAQPQQVSAGCDTAALCDATPGTCSTTCNGGQPCQINDGGWIEQCQKSCSCSTDSFLTCSIEGALCGGSGPNPYSSGSYGTCTCTTVEPCVLVETCSETTWAYCCAPGCDPNTENCDGGSPPPPDPFCGDGSCDAFEDCSNCGTDCGSCGGPVCGDNSCDGGEDCLSCTSDCGTCTGNPPVCGDATCDATESCSSCSVDCGTCLTCGDGFCDAGTETCETCAADCGACPPTCGDDVCSAFESCSTCIQDCGECPPPAREANWRVYNGHAGAMASTGTAIQSQIYSPPCELPTCSPALMLQDLDGTADTEAVLISGGGSISTNGYYALDANREFTARGTQPTRFIENFSYFMKNSDLGLTPSNDFTGQENDIQKPGTVKNAYYHQGDLTLQSQWAIAADESYVVFVDGDLTLDDPSDLGQLTTVEEGGFLAFFVSGHIFFTESVGNATLTDLTPNVEGIFLADNAIAVESRGTTNGGDDRFVFAGSLISWNLIDLRRDYDDGAARSIENEDKPTEDFIYRPDLLRNTPEWLTRSHSIWQETN